MGWYQRYLDRPTERRLQQRLAEEHELAWRRIAPDGTPLWLLPDDDLERWINEMAAGSQARAVKITYLLDELARREQGELNASLAAANRSMVRLTWAVVVLSVISTWAALAH
jgi:CHASE3 domain sensor protein